MIKNIINLKIISIYLFLFINRYSLLSSQDSFIIKNYPHSLSAHSQIDELLSIAEKNSLLDASSYEKTKKNSLMEPTLKEIEDFLGIKIPDKYAKDFLESTRSIIYKTKRNLRVYRVAHWAEVGADAKGNGFISRKNIDKKKSILKQILHSSSWNMYAMLNYFSVSGAVRSDKLGGDPFIHTSTRTEITYEMKRTENGIVWVIDIPKDSLIIDVCNSENNIAFPYRIPLKWVSQIYVENEKKSEIKNSLLTASYAMNFSDDDINKIVMKNIKDLKRGPNTNNLSLTINLNNIAPARIVKKFMMNISTVIPNSLKKILKTQFPLIMAFIDDNYKYKIWLNGEEVDLSHSKIITKDDEIQITFLNSDLEIITPEQKKITSNSS